MAKIKVQDMEITVVSFEERDYISLTDMQMLRKMRVGLLIS